MPKLKDIEQIRNVEWGKRFLWDISFESTDSGGGLLAKAKDIAKSKLDSYKNDFTGKEQELPTFGGMFEWFPITDVTDEVVDATTQEFDGTYSKYPIITGSKVLSISITFVDDIKGNMFNWCKEWLNPFTKITDDISVGIDTGAIDEVKKTPILDKQDSMRLETKCIKTISEYTKVIVVSKLDNQLNDISTSRYVVIPTGTLTFRGTSDDSLPTYELRMLKVKELEPSKLDVIPPRFDIIGSKAAGLLRKVTS